MEAAFPGEPLPEIDGVKLSSKALFPLLFWIWFAILLILNVIPIGNDMNKGLSGNHILEFRLDYLVHSITILGFAWLNLAARSLGSPGLKLAPFTALVVLGAVLYELVQYLIPWRSFNPVDMFYGFVGAVLAVLFVGLDGVVRSSRKSSLSTASTPLLKMDKAESEETG